MLKNVWNLLWNVGVHMIQYEAMWEKICADVINSPNKDIIFNYIRDDGYKTESNMKFWFSGTVNKEERKI